MHNPKMAFAGLLGASAIALNALGAHFIKEKAQLGIISLREAEGFDTGGKYQLIHAIVLLFLAILPETYQHNKWYNYAYRFIIAGTLCFSISLYALCTQKLTGIPFRWMGPITPIGGVLLILGWISICMLATQKNKTHEL